MTISRRDFLKLTALVTASAALSACTPAYVYRKLAGNLPNLPWTPLSPSNFLALNRLTFGPRMEERARFQEIGLHAFIEKQLDFDSINDLACDIRLELHTLGVDSGYTQQDVMELARCLTGWNVKEHFWLGDFVFKEDLHDIGVKKVLWLTIQNAGVKEAEQVLERLTSHPSTAHFIATKLTRRFIDDEPSP